MALELVAGALIGTALNELLGAIKDARRKISSFEPILTRLESTLVAISPKLHEITLLNDKLHSKHLHHHQSGIADLIILARDGKELVAKCSKLSSYNYVKKVQYAKMLQDLDCNLLRYFVTVLQLDQLKDTKQILLVLNELRCKLFPLDNDNDNDNDDKSRLIDDEIRSLSSLGAARWGGGEAEESEYEKLDEFTMTSSLCDEEDQSECSSSSLERDNQVDDDILKRVPEVRKEDRADQDSSSSLERDNQVDDIIRSLSDLDDKSRQIDAKEPEKELDEVTVKVEDQAEGSISFKRDYRGKNQAAVLKFEYVAVQNLGKNQAAATIHMAELDDIIARLLKFRKFMPAEKVQLTESEIRQICIAARDIFLQQPNLLQLEAPIKICGDIHGQYGDLLRLFEYGGFPPQFNYLFLGNYVDFGKQSLETICLLLCFKIKYPENVFLLRGNHECASISRIYGFYDECKRRFSVRLWKTFIDCFNCLPVAALVDNKIFCVHGGLSPELDNVHQITNIPRPTDVPDAGLLCDLLWSDPCRDGIGWEMNNDRGISYTFGQGEVSEFLYKNDMDLICRAHQVVEDGYEFFAKNRLVTIFSAPSFCGEYDNAGAMMSVDESITCSFEILKHTRS